MKFTLAGRALKRVITRKISAPNIRIKLASINLLTPAFGVIAGRCTNK